MKHRHKNPGDAPQRLRAIADAIEAGGTLIDVAARFRVPIRALHRVIVPKRSMIRPSEMITPEMLVVAAAGIRRGDSFAKVAASLNVPVSTLTTVMTKHGLTARNLRPALSPRDEKLQMAIRYYKDGRKVSEITESTGCKQRTLYTKLREQGVPLRQRRSGGESRSR